jgi:hypothetical protein
VQCAMLPLAAAAATQALHVARLHSYARPRQRRHHCARRRSDRIPAQPCKDALARILEEFIAKELRPYIRTFDTEFYEHLFRLRGLEFPKDSVKRPQYFGTSLTILFMHGSPPACLTNFERYPSVVQMGD